MDSPFDARVVALIEQLEEALARITVNELATAAISSTLSALGARVDDLEAP